MSVQPESKIEESDDVLNSTVLAAATRVFSAKGLSATLAEIATEAGVGVASVYRRYSNKDELIVAVYGPLLTQAAETAEAATKADDPWQGFVDYFRDNIATLASDRGFRKLALGAYAGTIGWSRGTPPVRVREMVERAEVGMAPHHVTLVRRAQEAGALRADLAPSDMLVLTTAVLSTTDFAGAAFTQLPQRVATVILDGLRPSRTGPTNFEVPPVSDEDLMNLRSAPPHD